MTATTFRAGVVFSGLVLACTAKPNPAAGPEAEAAIRAADSAWTMAFGGKQLEAAVAFVAPTGSILAPNTPIATGTEAVRQLFTGLMALPDLSIHWHPTTVHVSQSGELGYSIGVYEMSIRGPNGQPIPDHGKYSTVWEKQADGNWKVMMDIFNSDLPMPGQAP